MHTAKKKSANQVVFTVLRFVISFAAIGVILHLFRDQLPAVLRHLRDANLVYFGCALGVFFVGLIAVAVRLQLVLQVHSARLTLWDAYYVNLVALFFNNVLPSSVGGEMVKAYYVYRSTKGKVAAFSAVVVDRLFGLVTMVAVGLLAILVFDRAQVSPKIIKSLLLLAGMVATMLLAIFHTKIVSTLCRWRIPLIPLAFAEKLHEMYQAMYHYRGHRKIILGCVGLTVLGQFSFIVTNFFLARSLAMNIPLSFFFFFVPIILMLTLAPSVNGIGVREATYLYYLSGFTTPDKALALSVLTTFFMVFAGICGGVVYAFRGGLQESGEIPPGSPRE